MLKIIAVVNHNKQSFKQILLKRFNWRGWVATCVSVFQIYVLTSGFSTGKVRQINYVD